MMNNKNLIIGILALQGDFFEHRVMLEKLGVTVKLIKQPADLNGIRGLIIPGGESTVMGRLIDIFDLRKPLKHKINSGLPTWGTCAGLILLASQINGPGPDPLAALDIEVSRNIFGRQLDSFEQIINLKPINIDKFNAVFIRAPGILKIGKNVTVLGKLKDESVVAVRQNNVIGTSFHPELTDNLDFHGYFCAFVAKAAPLIA